MSDATLTEAERESIESTLRWHFNVVAEDGKDSSYISVGISNALRRTEVILAARLAEVTPVEVGAYGQAMAEISAMRNAHAKDSQEHARKARALARAEAALAEVRRTSRVLPCDGLCSDYAEEDCSLHGREPSELWEAIIAKNKRAEEAEAENAHLRDTLARVETLADKADARVDADMRLVTTATLRTALAGGDS